MNKEFRRILLIYNTLLITLLGVISCLGHNNQLSSRTLVTSTSDTLSETDATPTATATSAPLRPSDKITINTNYCACENGVPDIINNCSNFCSSNSDTVSTLYLSVTLDPEIELNPSLGNLHGWCSNEIPDGLTNPNCQLEVYDGDTTSYLDVTIPSGSNTLTAVINTLEKGKTYILTIVETGSGSNARSKSFQLIRKNFSNEVDIDSVLRVSPVHQYTCVTRSTGNSNDIPQDIPADSNYYAHAYKLYYYYPEGNLPRTLRPGQRYLYCHDINRFGADDNPLFPRMELIENSYYVWNEDDIRFYDLDNDGKLDINNLIQQELANRYSITSDINIFSEFQWRNSPETGSSDSTSASTNAAPRLGFIMTPWSEQNSNISYCPKQYNYDSNVPIFKILKNFVGVDTEGLYLGVREPITITDNNGNQLEAPTGLLLIREGLLKQIWFYYENGLHIEPDEESDQTKTMMFYWPPDTVHPYVRKGKQVIYTVTHPSDLNSEQTSGIRTSITSADKKFACIPSPD